MVEKDKPEERPWCTTHHRPVGTCGAWLGESKACVIRLRPEQEKTGTMPESPDSLPTRRDLVRRQFAFRPVIIYTTGCMVGIDFEKFSGQSEIMVERVVGVSPFIITPDGFFVTVEELRTKRLTGKTAGMRSSPMETVQPGETDQEALERLFGEEVNVPELSGVKPGPLLCRVQFRPGVWLHTYLFWGHKNFSTELGSETNEVTRPGWTHINDILSSEPSERRFRPGVREIVKSYIAYLEEGKNFKPRTFFSCEDTVPEEVFDELERQSKQA